MSARCRYLHCATGKALSFNVYKIVLVFLGFSKKARAVVFYRFHLKITVQVANELRDILDGNDVDTLNSGCLTGVFTWNVKLVKTRVASSYAH